MNLEWNAPETGCTMVLTPSKASAAMAASRVARAPFAPESTRPPGKSWFATVTAPAASARRPSNAASSRPTTVIMPLGSPASQAAFIASPRTLSSRTAVDTSITPAKASAVYSPSENPAQADASDTAFGSSTCSCRTAASEVRKTQTCEKRVSLSDASGPFCTMSKRSTPKTADASANISTTPGVERYGSSMPTFCAPCPGKSSIVPAPVAARTKGRNGTAPTSGTATSASSRHRNLAVHQPSTAA
mmetsp:Transcript_26361/g.88611  ORF Transcript_26361/g.88611 Transcript_26361/m.88611 type:complete len:246 (+) Transcript_26361:426-1163(+)